MHRLIKNKNHVWKEGLIMLRSSSSGNTYAKVYQLYDQNEIRIVIWGIYKKELLTIINEQFERIHNTYPNLKCEQWIPCNCKTCAGNPKPHFFKYELLRKYILNGLTSIICENSLLDVYIKPLIEDVSDEKIQIKLETAKDFKRLISENNFDFAF